MLAMTGACMVLAGGFGLVAMAMGLRIWCHQGESLRGQTTCGLLFLSGETVATPRQRVGGR